MNRTCCLLLACSCFLAARTRGAEPFTLDPTQDYQKTMGDKVPVPGADGAEGVRVKAEVPQYGWCTIPLGRTLPRGTYSAKLTVSAGEADAATAALQAIADNGTHYQITRPLGAPVGAAIQASGIGFVPCEFSAVAFKKMAKSPQPSVAFSRITITDLGQRDYPRLAAYRALMRYPAPWGIRCPTLSERIERASKDDASVGQMDEAAGLAEPWLDLRSAAADICCRGDYLLRLARLQKAAEIDVQRHRVERGIRDLKQAMADDRRAQAPALLDEADRALAELEAALAEKLNAVVRPESGTDIFTWTKAWRLVGMPRFPELAEPTPYRADYVGLSLKLAEPVGKAALASTWTTNTYREQDMTVRYSVLTPLVTTDLRNGRFSMGIKGLAEPRIIMVPAGGAAKWTSLSAGQLEGADAKMSSGWFALRGNRHTLLLVLNRKPTSARWTGQRLEMAFKGPAAVGYVICGNGQSEQALAQMGAFYQAVLRKQPVECVQVERRRQIEQTFEYLRRDSDWPVPAVTLAPLPHLATLSRAPTSALRIAMDQEVRVSPDGWEYVPDSATLRYVMPERPRNHSWGTNLYPATSTLKIYQELAAQGCRTIRLTCGGLTPWASLSPDEHRKMIRDNLQWARQAGGMKVGVDMHMWAPSQEYGDPGALDAFVERWKMIISWCSDYRDVVDWYDLLNEPMIFHDSQDVRPYAKFMRQAVKALRPLVADTPILVEAVDMANPVGLEFWEDLGDENVIVGFHDYWPHLFTHQWAVDKGNPAMPRVFFPSFMPMIEWSSPSWRNDHPHFHYWDRWKCDAISYPVFRKMIETGGRFDCGEYGVVGYAGQACVRSGVLWMHQALERFERMGINHNVWSRSDSSGFTFLVPEFKAETLRFWREWREDLTSGK